jgi:ribosomal protein L29
MKGNDRQAKKNLSAGELQAELRQAQEKRFRLAFKHQVTPVKNPRKIRNHRRHIARLKTRLEQKQAAPAVKEAR